jgi:hypothetical protein
MELWSDQNDIVNEFKLFQNYPNPFNPNTSVRYSVPESISLSITVFNVLGQKIATLYEGQQNSGLHQVSFDGSNLSSGIYIIQLQTEKHSQIVKALLLK